MRAGNFAFVLWIAACSAPREHLGAVTGICVLDRRVIACSQAGVLDADGRTLLAPPFRPVQVFAGADRTLWLCGGQPAASGWVACQALQQPLRSARVADDLIYDIAVHHDEVALACADGRVLLANKSNLSTTHMIRQHTAAARAVAFAPDTALLASGGLDGIVLLGAATSPTPLVLQDHTAGIECLAWSPDGTELASGARDGKVRIHAPDGRLRRTYLRLGAPVLALVFDPQQAAFCAALRDGSVLALDPGRDTTRRLVNTSQPVQALAAAQGTLILGLDGKIEAWPR